MRAVPLRRCPVYGSRVQPAPLTAAQLAAGVLGSAQAACVWSARKAGRILDTRMSIYH